MFTTSHDRSDARGRLDLARLSSPGGIAAQIPARLGVRAPMETFALTTDEQDRWAQAFHGGLCVSDPRFERWAFGSAVLDAHSCFVLVAHLIGWWDLLSAERIERQGATAELRRFCQAAVADPLVTIDPRRWAQFGCTLVEVMPDGEPYPVEVVDPHRPDGRLEVKPLMPCGRTFWFPAFDVISAALGSGRVPRIVRAIRYVPVGRQSGIRRRLHFLPGLVLDSQSDPGVALVKHRFGAKSRGNLVLAAELRVIAVSLVFGNLCRFDDIYGPDGVADERPGPWLCFPIASSVTAGSRLLLAILDRFVRYWGSALAYCDTDSGIIPASPDGGTLVLPDGSTVRELSWADVDDVVGRFAALSPAPWWPVWKVTR